MTPEVRGGRPKIAWNPLTVSRIAGWYKMGMTPEEIAHEYPHLTLAQVHAALAYYRVNRDAIETDIARRKRLHSVGSSSWGFVGQEMRRIMRLISRRPAEQIRNRLESLSSWA